MNVTKLETDTKYSVDEHVKELEGKAEELLENALDAKSKDMKVDDASSMLGTVQEYGTEDNIEELIEDTNIENNVEETVDDLYSDLTAAMAGQNNDLENAIMDKILESYDKKVENLEEKKENKER